jgi:indole-3-glycerol phosphate synthase
MPPSFIDSLLSAPLPIIMEIKRRDARGKELIGARLLPEIVAAYEAAGAPCLSVVTGPWFGGKTALLNEIAALTRLPLLKKDFITREEQIVEARDAGASAVLLTACLLPRSVLRNLVEVSIRQGLTPFIEVASATELDGLDSLMLAGCVVAVNNKDILHRERGPARLGRSSALLPAILASGTKCPVSASGIDSPAQAARLLDAGFKGLLVGTALLMADDVAAWVTAVDRCRKRSEAL